MTSNHQNPKLRLKGFADKWEETILGDISKMYQPETISTTQFNVHGKYTVFGANGIIGKYDRYNHDDEEILITCRGATCGTINLSIPKSWITGNAMVVNPNTPINKKFIYYNLCQINFSQVITGQAQPQITRQSLMPLIIFIPSLPEQQAIAMLFTTLDNHINLLQRQLKTYKDYKKSMLQKLFPNKDSKTPQLRIKGFNDDWRETTLVDVFNEISEKNFPDKQVLMASQSYGIIPHDNLQRSIIRSKDNLSGYKLVKAGDFVISLRSFEGGFEYSNCEGIISPAYVILRNKLPISSYYFKQYFKSDAFINNYILKNMNLSLRDGKTISYKEASKYNLLLPSMPEQEAIATLFTNLDNHITNLSTQLELYNKKKKALLKNIFPSI